MNDEKSEWELTLLFAVVLKALQLKFVEQLSGVFMKKIWFSPGESNRKSIKLRKLGAHFIHKIAPQTSTALTLKLLCNPRSKRDYHFKQLSPTESFKVDTKIGKVKVFRFGNPLHPAVLLSHGWADTSRRMESIIKELLDNGYSAYTFDQIGHGKSEGKVSHLFGFVDGLECVISHIEERHPLKAVISHSMGGLAALNLDKNHFENKKIALISPPVKFFEEMMHTIGKVGLPESIGYSMLNQVSLKYKKPWEDLQIYSQRHKINHNCMVIHDKSDKYCSFTNSQNFFSKTNANFITTQDLGHHRILSAKSVHSEILKFIKG